MKELGGFSVCFLAFFGLVGVASGRSLFERSDLEPSIQASGYHLIGYPLEEAKGYGGEYESGYRSGHGKKGDEGYKNYRKHARGNVAHSDQSQLSGHHGEDGGHKKSYHDEGNNHHYGYYEENGEKGHKYGQKSGHKKGHSTKGVHDVHKLNEYKKNKEFFDEDYEEENYEKHGGYHHKLGADEGKFYKLGHENRGYELGYEGKTGREGNLFHYLGLLGKANNHGHHGYYSDGEKYGKNKGLGQHVIWERGYQGF